MVLWDETQIFCILECCVVCYHDLGDYIGLIFGTSFPAKKDAAQAIVLCSSTCSFMMLLQIQSLQLPLRVFPLKPNSSLLSHFPETLLFPFVVFYGLIVPLCFIIYIVVAG